LRNRPFDTGNYGRIWFINGVIAETTSAAATSDIDSDLTVADMNYDDLELYSIPLYKYPFEAHYMDKEEPLEGNAMYRSEVQFDYAYAITVHKSQGSEWDNVLLVDDEMNANNIRFRRRWLYTAVTRAKERLTWLTQN
jgi:exodeoxyribonuclease-5